MTKDASKKNGVIMALRSSVPYLAFIDYFIIAIIGLKIAITLFVENSKEIIDNSAWMFLFNLLPAFGVILTGSVAAGLITSHLAKLESERGDLTLIRKEKARKERQLFINGQISLCVNQRVQAVSLLLAYVIMTSLPSILSIDPRDGFGRFFLIILLVGEMIVPLLNIRTFSIVEESMDREGDDIIKEGMRRSQRAALSILDKISDKEDIDRRDANALKHGRHGDIDAMLVSASSQTTTPLNGDNGFISLLKLVTGKDKLSSLSEEEKRRLEKAKRIARAMKIQYGDEASSHFRSGKSNALYVSHAVGVRIIEQIVS